jgi:hypothetical protein
MQREGQEEIRSLSFMVGKDGERVSVTEKVPRLRPLVLLIEIM